MSDGYALASLEHDGWLVRDVRVLAKGYPREGAVTGEQKRERLERAGRYVLGFAWNGLCVLALDLESGAAYGAETVGSDQARLKEACATLH
jgi:hypothetical protein